MGEPSYTAITVERQGAADWVTLSRPDVREGLQALIEKRPPRFGRR